jgi:hypothetical protein
LNLLSTYPEAMSLLDQFIEYARSPQFQPQGSFDPHDPGPTWKELMALWDTLNGWSKTLSSAEDREYGSFLGPYLMRIARQTDGTSTVAWKTRPAPQDLDPAKPCTFTWVAGLGYISEPAGHCTMFLGAQPLLEFDVTQKNTAWRSADGDAALNYIVKSVEGVDSSGLMQLSVPGSRLTPGQPAELRIVGSAAHSQRWFGLYEIR